MNQPLKSHIKEKYFAKANRISTSNSWTLDVPENKILSLQAETFVYNYEDSTLTIFNNKKKILSIDNCRKYLAVFLVSTHMFRQLIEREMDISLFVRYIDGVKVTKNFFGLNPADRKRADDLNTRLKNNNLSAYEKDILKKYQGVFK